MKKLIMALGLAVLTAVSASANTAYLQLSDNNGNSTVLFSSGTGVITFIGSIGNWDINVSTGIANPPAGGQPVTAPEIDLNSVNHFKGGAGNQLTIKFYADGLGPVSSAPYKFQIGGTKDSTIASDVFSVIAGPTLSTSGTQTATSSPFALTLSGFLNLLPNQNLGIQAVLNATAAGLTSFDANLAPVPDAGMTIALLGSALTGLALFARNRKTA
jgi:hypothetical protein